MTALTGHPYLQHPAPIAIFNGQGSGCLLHVKLLNARPMTGPQALQANITLSRITGLSGGTTVVPFKMNTANSDLPSQVVATFAPETVTGATSLRSTFLASEANFTRSLSQVVSRMNGDSRFGFDSGEFLKMAGKSIVQRHTLNEGQGIAINMTTDGPTVCFGLSVLVRNRANNQCYHFNDMIEPRFAAGTPVWGILNGAGSGVVLEIVRVQIRELGTDEVPYLNYEPIDGIDWDSEDAVFMMADSAESLPANVFIKKNCVTTRAGAKYGLIVNSPAYRRVTMAEPPWGAGINGGPQIARRGIFAPDMDTRGAAPITLREGQGISLLIRNPSAQLFHEFTATIDIESPDPVVSGARSFAF